MLQNWLYRDITIVSENSIPSQDPPCQPGLLVDTCPWPQLRSCPVSLSGFEGRGRHAPQQGGEGAALGYDTSPHHQLGAPSVAFLEADESVDQDTDGAQAACGEGRG